MTCFVGLGIFREKRMSPKELARYNKNKQEYEKKYKDRERQMRQVVFDQKAMDKGAR